MKGIAYSCTHVPLTDPDWETWLVKRIKKEKPDVIVHMGDGHEALSASRWPSVYHWTMQDERRAMSKHFDRISKAAPNARKIFLMGNHDDNMLNVLRIESAKYGEETFDWTTWYPQLEGDWEIGSEYVYDPKWGAINLGQVTLTHGYSAGTNADKEMAIVLGMPHGLTISGHTHRPSPVTKVQATTRLTLPYWTANPGCGRTLKPDYVKQKLTADWGQGLVLFWYEDWRYPNYMPKEPRWEAVTEIFKMSKGARPDFHHRIGTPIR
jgi:predicted phosphodiesterase